MVPKPGLPLSSTNRLLFPSPYHSASPSVRAGDDEEMRPEPPPTQAKVMKGSSFKERSKMRLRFVPAGKVEGQESQQKNNRIRRGG